ncbi:MAG: L,D-transpeptidase [Hyphomicrobiales bacterium]
MRKSSVAAIITFCLAGMASQACSAAGSFEVLGAMQDDGGQGSLNGGVLDFSPGGNSGPVEAPHTVAFTRDLEPGSILVRTSERKLYFVLPGGQALVYPIGVGRDGFRWSGTNRISRKQEWPEWRPPKVMIAREMARGHYIPEFMAGGEGNPLGARALYIGQTEFRIHGTTQPWSIGKAVSSGCIRMLNEQVIDLYDRVAVGARVIVE